MTLNAQTILIVEDEADDAFFLRRALQKANLSNPIQFLENGEQVIDYLQGHGAYADRLRFPVPVLILLDLKLPGANGLEVLRWIRQESGYPTLPVVVVTSSLLLSDIEAAYRCGANSCIVKPSDPATLIEMVDDMSRWWLRHNVSAYVARF